MSSDYTAWLVEKRDHPTMKPAYLALDDMFNLVWVPEADDAVHFARKADGDRMCINGENHDLAIVEHLWPGGDPREPVIPSWEEPSDAPIVIERERVVYDDDHQGNFITPLTGRVEDMFSTNRYRVVIVKPEGQR